MKISKTKTLAISVAIFVLGACALAPLGRAQELGGGHLGPPGGNVISLAASSANTVYLGTADGHIFISQDAGEHWALRGRASSRHDAVVQKLLVDTQHEKELLAAVWFQDVREGGGLYRSSDAGATWAVAGLAGEIVRTVEQSPSAPEIFVAGTRSGVFRSADGAQTWQRISPAGDPELRNVDSVAIDPHNALIIYAGTYHLPWRTTDAGKTWTAVAAGMIDDSDVMSLRVDAANSTRIFASACSGIYRSENSGEAWTKLQGIPYSSRRTQAIVQDPQDPRAIYAATTEGLWVTKDGGESWTRTSPRDWVVNDVVVLLARSSAAGAMNEILLGTERQGILLSRDGGQTFSPVNEGFFHRITGALVSDPRDANHLLAWMPDSPDPLIESRDGGAAWAALPVASPAESAPADISRIFSTEAGWWVATSGGVLEFYDPATSKWSALKFVAAMERPARGAHSAAPVQRRAIPRPNTAAVLSATSDITDIRSIGARVFVATSQALWVGILGEKVLRPVKISAVPNDASTDEVFARCMVVSGEILCSQNDGKTWRAESLNVSAELQGASVRWIREVRAGPIGGAAKTNSVAGVAEPKIWLLAGTSKGLFRRANSDGSWRLVQNGLARGEPIAYFFGDKISLIALRGGGLYLSRDAAKTWERLDTGALAGQFTGVTLNANGEIVAASLTEGLLQAPTAE
jgi:photosystem II stability/assembly factor-like uncharacterized protein